MGCESFENIVDFLKTTIPDMTKPQMEKIITQVRMFFSLLFPLHLVYFKRIVPILYAKVSSSQKKICKAS